MYPIVLQDHSWNTNILEPKRTYFWVDMIRIAPSVSQQTLTIFCYHTTHAIVTNLAKSYQIVWKWVKKVNQRQFIRRKEKDLLGSEKQQFNHRLRLGGGEGQYPAKIILSWKPHQDWKYLPHFYPPPTTWLNSFFSHQMGEGELFLSRNLNRNNCILELTWVDVESSAKTYN